MDFDDDNEMHDLEIFGLRVNATYAEQRWLWLTLSTSDTSREWGICRNLIALTEAPVPMPVHEALAVRMEDADKAMTKLANRLIGEMIQARS